MKERPFPIRLIDDYIAILPDTPPEKIGSIIVPDTAKDRPTRGTVVGVGKGRLIILQAGGAYHPLTVKVGDRVLYKAYSGSYIEVAGKTYTILREPDILGVDETEKPE